VGLAPGAIFEGFEMAQKKSVEASVPERDNTRVFANGVKLVGEAIIPGASLMLDGKVVNGAAHAAVGLAARIVIGPAALVLAAADSYSKSVSDKYLWDHARDLWQKRRPAAAVEPEEVVA
jgi:hypothetical protein